MDARHLVATDGVDSELVGVVGWGWLYGAVGLRECAHLPVALAVEVGHDLLGEGDAGARGVVELVDVVSLGLLNVVLWEAVHYLGQVLVDGGEDSNADGVVGCPEESLALLGTCLAHVVAVLLEPTGRAADYLYSGGPRLEVVAVCHVWGGELYGYLG